MSFAIKVDARLRALEEASKKHEEQLAALLFVLSGYQARIEALEAKRGPGRPPNAERNAPRSDRAL